MSEVDRIAKQLHRSYAGPAWHGPSLNELLSGVTEAKAAARPVSGAHSIWEIVLHISAWMRIARERLSAEVMRPVQPSEDWPSVTGRWTDAVAELDREERALEEAVRAFPDSRLREKAPAPEPQTFYVMLHGVVQHNLYHAGQIAILKK